MMISPETFYEMNLKGKKADQIMTVIRGLKQEIGRLKNVVEHPDYVCLIKSSERTRISCSQDYLERAKQALVEVGGTYIPSAAEKKEIEFNENIQYINKVEFCIGGYFGGYETKTYAIDGNKVHTHIEHSLILEPSNIGDFEIEEIDKDYLFEMLQRLHIGGWRKNYNTRRFGYMVCDGTQWHLKIYFSNGHKPIKIYGDNAYPYNFNQLLELFKVEN